MQEIVTGLLSEATKALCRFLAEHLPKLGDDWWEARVVNSLTFNQRSRAYDYHIRDLTGLDLASLLRVFDRNYYGLCEVSGADKDSLHIVKEMGTVRNRWSHVGSVSPSAGDSYRDLDTIERLFKIVGGSAEALNRARSAKVSLMGAGPEETEGASSMGDERGKFEVTQQVHPISRPDAVGVVLGVLPNVGETRYRIFIDGKEALFYESQLRAVERLAADRTLVPLANFRAYLTALELTHPGLESLYSLHAARINYEPYQFKPVLKFIRADRPRLLIADEVGVGKTIEAGLIIRELQARMDLRSVAVLCPKPLVTDGKWLNEMKRFDEDFEHVDGKALRYLLSETGKDGVWPDKHAKVIIPFSLFNENTVEGAGGKRNKRGSVGLFDLDPPPSFDLVIVDEAHHIRNTDTYTHRAVRFFCDNAEAAVFLTATPIQLGDQDQFVLLNVLRPDLIIDYPSFKHMGEPNKYVNAAVRHARGAREGWQSKACTELVRAVNTPWGQRILSRNPEFQEVYDSLSNGELTQVERVNCIRTLENLNTFRDIINRTRRRDIGKFATRNPTAVSVDFTPNQRRLHDSLLEAQRRILEVIHGDINLNFAMSMLRRQVASCVYGLAPLIEDILTRRLGEIFNEGLGEYIDEDVQVEFQQGVRAEIDAVLQLAKEVGGEDPKLGRFLDLIMDKQKLSNNKVLVFSTFRHTLRYLLRSLLDAGMRVALIQGDTPDEDRLGLRQRFARPRDNPEAVDILLSSEVGCEGLDYEFCDCLVNYDIPWNPMRVEQRIGRLDRYGQKSDVVAIYNFITPGTVDFEIYQRCLVRIGVFNNALGGSEEILGDITKEIKKISDDLNLTPEQVSERLQQLADSRIRKIQEQEEVEAKQEELLGLAIPRDQIRKEVEDASSSMLTPKALENLIAVYMQDRCRTGKDYLLGDKQPRTLRTSQEDRAALLEDHRNMKPKPSAMNREWEKWLKGNEPHLSLAFEQATASQHRNVQFVHPVHPLARQAAKALAAKPPMYSVFKVTATDLRPGTYPFAVYMWEKRGYRNDVSFTAVAENENVMLRFQELLETAQPPEGNEIELPPQNVFDGLEDVHFGRWREARKLHEDSVLRIIDYKLESLNTSHAARIALLQEQLGAATEDRIRRMREAQIRNAEGDYSRRKEKLLEMKGRIDVTTQPIAYGVVIVGEADDNIN